MFYFTHMEISRWLGRGGDVLRGEMVERLRGILMLSQLPRGNRKVQTTPLPLALEGDGALKCLSCARRLD